MYTLVLTFLGFEKHLAFKTSAWDLGSFNQAFSSTLSQHGFFTYNLEPYTNPGGSFFGIHFSPLMLALLPLYAVAPSIPTLLLIQAAALALGAIPIYRVSLLKGASVLTAVASSISYLMYFPMWAANLFDFHLESFMVAPILFSIYFMIRERWKWFAVSIILALSSMEYSVFLVAALGVAYAVLNFGSLRQALQERRYLTPTVIVPVTMVALALSWFIVAFSVISFFNPSPPKEFNGAENWKLIGSSTLIQIPFSVILNPIGAIHALSFDASLKLMFVVLLLLPLLFLPLLEPRALILAAPWLFFAALSNYPPYYQIGIQYTMFTVPGLFWALLWGVGNLKRFTSNRKIASNIFRHASRYVMVTCLITCIIAITLISAPYAIRPPDQHIQYLNAIIQLVPSTSSVLTQNNLFPHFSERSNAYAIPVEFPFLTKVFPVIVNKTFSVNPDFILIDSSYDTQAASITSMWLRAHGGYGLYASADWIVLLKRGFMQSPVYFLPLQISLDHSQLNLYQGQVVQDPSSRSGFPIFRPASSNSSVWFASSKNMVLPPGVYNADVSMKSSRGITGNALTIQVFGGNTTVLLSSVVINGSSFQQPNKWVSVTFEFRLDNPEIFQISGRNATASADIYLDSIRIIQR